MKQVSAILIILAILNPLCCCLAVGEGHVVDTPMKADHSCCNSESKAPDAPGSQKDATNCEHEQSRDFVVSSNVHVIVPFATLAAHEDLFQWSHEPRLDHTSSVLSLPAYEWGHAVPSWISIQTNCVRRL